MKFYLKEPCNDNLELPYCVLSNGWNDWGFLTTFSLFCYIECEHLELGNVKIGKKKNTFTYRLYKHYKNSLR